ncbi:MAG: hypothetical protein IT208_14415 [Chthonomonadales bacterium]|nr:hypothetical protein [Chthonomonadales bacterium]
MLPLRSAVRYSLAFVLLLALIASRAQAAPTIDAPEVYAMRDPGGVESGTEKTVFVFRAIVTPSANNVLTGPPSVVIGPVFVDNELFGGWLIVDMQPDGSPGRPQNAYIGFVTGAQMNAARGYETNGVGRPREHEWVIAGLDTDANDPIGYGPGTPGLVHVYPSTTDLQTGSPRPVFRIRPVGPNGQDDKAPGPGQLGNGLRVDPQDPTAPNDGGGAHTYTWRVRVSNLYGLPMAFYRPYFEWNRGQQGPVVLTLIGPDNAHYWCPMEIDDSFHPGLTASAYPADGPNGLVHPAGSQVWIDGVVARYRMMPTQYSATPFGGDLQGSPPAYTAPDGLPTEFVALDYPGAEPIRERLRLHVFGRPHGNDYAAFAALDPILKYLGTPFWTPPRYPTYSGIPNRDDPQQRVGQWKYYYSASVDFRIDMGGDPSHNFIVQGAGRVTGLADNFGANLSLYQTFSESDDPMGYPSGDPEGTAYRHPWVTPIVADGGWTDDLAANQALLPEVPYAGTSNNARRSRVTTKTAVRYLCRVASLPQRFTGQPVLVRVFVPDASGALQPHAMQPLPIPGNNDHTKGVIYYYDTAFPVGQEGRKAVYFEADDGEHKAIWPRRPDDDTMGTNLPTRGEPVNFGTGTVGRNYVMEPWVNNRPTLSNPTVNPSSGAEKQAYTYEVTYSDRDGDEPLEGYVVVDGVEYRMTPVDNASVVTGRRYRFVITQLEAIVGKHTYYFKFRDNWAPGAPIRREFGEWVNLPSGDDLGNPSGVIEGPVIVGNTPPELVEPYFAYSPATQAQTPATLYDFVVRYRDGDNDKPATVKFYISADGGVSYDSGQELVPAEAGTNYVSGVQYHLPNRITLPVGSNYRVKFSASDGKAETTVIHVGTGANAASDGSARELRHLAGRDYVDPQGTRNWLPQGLYVYEMTTPDPRLLTLGTQYTLDAAAGKITLMFDATAPIVASFYCLDAAGPVVGPNHLPRLTPTDLADSPNFKTVAPLSGSPETEFTFTIIYSDEDNQPPVDDNGNEGVYVVIDNSQRLLLQRDPAAQPPLDYVKGIAYSAKTTLSVGEHNYFFEANDLPLGATNRSGDKVVFPEITASPNRLPGPVVVNLGTLSEAPDPKYILPFPKGGSTQSYLFTVLYTNTDGIGPKNNIVELRVRSKITGETSILEMKAIDPIGPDQYKAGVRYQLQIAAPNAPLAPGDYEISFGFHDLPASAPAEPLVLAVNGPPVLSNGALVADHGTPISRSDKLTFSVTYTDINGDPPVGQDGKAAIRLFVDDVEVTTATLAPDPTDAAQFPRFPAVTSQQIRDGQVFTWKVAVKDLPGGGLPGQHTYQFRSADDFGEASNDFPPAPASFEVVGSVPPELIEPGPASADTNNGTIDAKAGAEKRAYLFSVIYKHLQGIEPTRIELVLDPGSANEKRVTMQPKAGQPSPLPYKTGVTYQYLTAPGELSPGQHTYRFEAADTLESAELPKAPATYQGPLVNHTPVLSAGTVFIQGSQVVPSVDQLNQLNPPITATVLDKVIFRVTYADADAAATPVQAVKVWLNDQANTSITLHPVSPEPRDYAAGVVYESDPTPLAARAWEFHFTGEDTLDTGFFPASGDIVGLDVKNVPQLLEPTPGEAATNNGTLDPVRGALNGQYTFKVIYKHLDGTQPTSIRLLIDPGQSGQRSIDLQPSGSGSPVDGVEYAYTTQPGEIASGQHHYRFEASDGMTTTSLPAGEDTYTGPTINNPPTLSAIEVQVTGNEAASTVDDNAQMAPPISVSAQTTMVFRVKYADADGVAPTQAGRVTAVVDDGTVVPLQPKAGDPLSWTEGVVYESAAVTLSAGQRTFHIEVSDGYEDVRLPDAAEVGGITIRRLATLTAPAEGTLAPAVGPPSTEFAYRVTYSHPDGTAPGVVRVFIDGVSHDMTRATSSTDYTNGVVYEFKYRFAADTQRTHTYRFEATDSALPGYTAQLPTGGGATAGPTVNTAFFTTPTFTQPGAQTPPYLVGKTITVQGRLDTNAPVANATVNVQLVKPDGSGATGSATPSADGGFTFTSADELDQTGEWKVRLTWNGAAGQYDPTSAEFTFKVTGVTMQLTSGKLDMIALPLIPVTPDLTTTFGPARADQTPLAVTVLDLIKWMPLAGTNGRYVSLNRDTNFPGAAAGQAYWTRPTESVVLAPRGKLWDKTQPYSITLPAGWSMIGSVYLEDINWGAAEVRFQGQSLPVASAGQVLRPFAWGYNPATGSYEVVQPGQVLKSGRGYWVRALQPCELVLPPPGRTAQLSRASDVRTDALQIVARIPGMMDTDNYLPTTGATASRLAMAEKPPYLGDFVSVSLLPAESLPAESRAAGATTMGFEVTSNRANTDVTLQFPNVSALSRRFEISVVDLGTKTTRALGTSSSYVYNTGENGAPRRFAVLVKPVTVSGRLVITGMRASARSAGSLSFAYTLSGSATVRAQVVGVGGRVFRTLGQGRAASQGVNTLLWDGRDERGIAVPAGAYLLKVTAADDQGRAATAVLPVTLVR